MSNDWEIKMSQARDRLPLRKMMMERGKAIPADRKNFKCPYCGSDSASLFHPHGGRNEMFKCFSTKCPTQTCGDGAAWDEVKFLAYESGLQDRDAAVQYLKEAGVWTERDRTAPSVMPGSRARRRRLPQPPQEKKEPAVEESAPAEAPPPPVESKEPPLNPADVLPSAPVEEPATEPEVKSNEPADDGGFVPMETPEGSVVGQAAVDDFYSRMTLSEADERQLFLKRGLTSTTSRELGFVSNPESNYDVLMEMASRHSWDELSSSGLWLPENKKQRQERRPNPQFCGLGQKGQKPKEDRRGKKDRWVWGMVHPILIPYFDEHGRIVKLRPHKGGAPGNTLCGASRIYVPRAFRTAADRAEMFWTVVICEGDFKAAALWQTLGAGAGTPDPIGVCAIPGINFANNFDLREELESWLRTVQCRQVIVAFDNEDKSHKPLRSRHEAVIWARYLAIDLARKLHITGKVCVLPNEWRDANKKADWDGALAKFVHMEEAV